MDTDPEVPQVFDDDADWRFPLRIGIPPHGGVMVGVTSCEPITLGVDGLDCDIAVAQTVSDLRVFAGAGTFSANLVLILRHPDEQIDAGTAAAAAHGVGAIGYAIGGFTAEKLPVLMGQLTAGATIETALRACGPHTLVGDPNAFAVSPLDQFLRNLATVAKLDAWPTVTGTTRPAAGGRPRSVIPPGQFPAGRAALPPPRPPSAVTALDGRSVSEELDRRRAGPAGVSRFLQAALHRRESDGAPGAQLEFGVLRGQPMILLVGVGPLGPARLVANVALDETQLGTPASGGWDLEITLKPESGEIARQSVRLPTTGPSADVRFPIETTPGSDEWRGRITVWHRARAIQSAILTAPVIDTDTDPGTGQGPRLVIDGEFHPMAGLDAQSAGGVTVELDAKPAVYSRAGDFLIEPREDEMRNASNRIATKLGEMAVELDEAADLADPRSRALLEYLAVQGSLLWKALFPDQSQRDSVKGERFLQALRLSDAAPELPYEFIYDLPSPPPDFTLCTDWIDGIPGGTCPRCHAAAADNRNILCPLGFWGLSKVIERHNAVGARESRAQARLRRGDVAGRAPMQLKRAVLALSEKADRAPRGAPATYIPPSSQITQALEAAGLPFDGPIADWRDWEKAISANQPDLLIVLAHARFDEYRGEWSMQIGSGSDLYLTRVFPEYVDAPPGIPGPVVFLFGCLTASEGTEQATFAREFRQHNASVVVGTTSTVLGRQAGPVAAGLVAAVKEAAGEQPLGELLRQARATGLASGSLMAMALNAFGDADYRLTV